MDETGNYTQGGNPDVERQIQQVPSLVDPSTESLN